jgi:lipopolysaccharide biosynthesis protein
MSGIRSISAADRAVLDEFGIVGMARPNGGLDFGAWRDLLESGAADGANSVLLANDSVFGPFAPLAPIMSRMAGFDAWGMVESREGRTHLQSWFVWMSANAFHRPAVQRVFGQRFEVMTKPEIIVHGELGLAAAFEAEGLDVGARYQALFRLRPSAMVATNPMHFHWRRLLVDGTVPFLKAELLRRNPSRIVGVRDWEALVSQADRAMILAALDSPVDDAAALGLRQTILQLGLRRDRWAMLRSLMRERLVR